jgi:outer membrane protein assembly factor BamB
VATVWKNGKLLWRLTDGANGAEVMSVLVSGADVYAGGYGDSPDLAGAAATVWKNGEALWHLTDGNACAASLFVSGGDVYAGGWEYGQDGKEVAVTWKNGDALWRQGDGSPSSVGSIFVK